MFPFDDLPPALRPQRIKTLVIKVGEENSLKIEGGDLPRGLAAAIGSFDGVHLGHQHVIESALTAGRARAETRVRAFIDFLGGLYGDVPEWDR